MNTQPFNKFLSLLNQQKTKEDTKIVFLALGNPDSHSRNSKHNAGQLVLNKFREWPIVFEDKQVVVHEYNSLLIAFSKTYMNDSGDAVKSLNKRLGYFLLVVVHDDLDLDIGEIKFKLESTQCGAHGGLKSIVKLGACHRIRVGIGSPQRVKNVVAKYVLSKWTPSELQKFDEHAEIMIDEVDKI